MINSPGRQMQGNLTAASYMLLSVLAYSFIPLVIARSGAADSPFLFNSVWRFGLDNFLCHDPEFRERSICLDYPIY